MYRTCNIKANQSKIFGTAAKTPPVSHNSNRLRQMDNKLQKYFQHLLINKEDTSLVLTHNFQVFAEHKRTIICRSCGLLVVHNIFGVSSSVTLEYEHKTWHHNPDNHHHHLNSHSHKDLKFHFQNTSLISPYYTL